MGQRTSRYTPSTAEPCLCRRLAVLLLLLVLAMQNVVAQGIGGSLQSIANSSRNGNGSQQQKVERRNTEPEIEYPLLNGLDVGVDILGPATKLLGSDNYSAEAFADLDLKHRFFPTVELGYGRSSTTNDYDTRYNSKTPYARLGADYNVLYKKRHGNMLLFGFRYGFGTTTYDVSTPADSGSASLTNLTDPIWGDSGTYSHEGMKTTMHWIELCAGVRVNVSGRIYMTWNVRLKYKLSASVSEYGAPYYVGGYGRYKNSVFGLTYSIVYRLPVRL